MNSGNTDETPVLKVDNSSSASQPQKTSSGPESGNDKEKHVSEAARKPEVDVNAAVATAWSFFQKVSALIKALSFDPLIPTRTLERFIAWVRKLLTPELFETISARFTRLGHAMLIATSALSLLYWVIASIKESTGIYLLFGLGFSALFIVLQYTAHKFLNAGKTLVLAAKSHMGSAAFLDCVALLSGIAGIAIFIKFLTFEDWNHFWAGLGYWFICDLIAYVSLNPSMLNIHISENTGAGEEAIGIISFFVKAFMRIVPIAFGTGVTLGFILCFSETCLLLKEGGNTSQASDILARAAFFGCLPFIGYVIFVIYHLTIDILKAILVIPAKLDQINDKKRKNGE